MPLFAKVQSFLRNFFSSRHVDIDLDQEVHAHLELLTAENIRAAASNRSRSRFANNASATGSTPSALIAATVFANSARTSAPPPSWFLPSRCPSARPPQSLALYTACCCGRSHTSIQTGSWPSSRLTPRVAGHILPTPTSTTFAIKTAASRP